MRMGIGRLSLQWRLQLAGGALALAAVVTVAMAARQGTRHEFFRYQQFERLSKAAVEPDLIGRLAADLDGRCCESAFPTAASSTIPAGLIMIVVEESSGSVVASRGQAAARLEGLAVSRDQGRITVEATLRGGLDRRKVVIQVGAEGVPLRLANGRSARLFLVPFPEAARAQNEANFLGSLDRRLIAAAGLVALLALGGTWLLARSIAGPLGELRAATADLATGDLGRRVAPRGGREVAELGQAFNTMADELERQQTLRRSLVHDVAHELRTPLTALRCRLETVLGGG